MKFECIGGPYGDCTSSYKVTDFPTTVGELLKYILEHKKDEWGYIYISNYRNKVAEYRCGTIVKPLSDEYKDVRISSLSADGGWSRMDYIVN